MLILFENPLDTIVKICNKSLMNEKYKRYTIQMAPATHTALKAMASGRGMFFGELLELIVNAYGEDMKRDLLEDGYVIHEIAKAIVNSRRERRVSC